MSKIQRRRCQNGKDSARKVHEGVSRGSSEAYGSWSMNGLVSTLLTSDLIAAYTSIVFRASIDGVVYPFFIHVDLVDKSERDFNFKFIMTGGL